MLWVCAECSTAYSVGAPRCPHCSSTEYAEEGIVPKISVVGGPSNAGDPTPEPVADVAEVEPDEVEPDVAVDDEPEPESEPEDTPAPAKKTTAKKTT